MARPLTSRIAVRQVLRLRAAALGITPTALAWRLQHWGMEKACTAPLQKDDTAPKIAQAIAAYYAQHPEETPPWERR